MITISAPTLVGTSEIAAMLGVTRQRVSQLSRVPGFPEPFVILAQGPIWDREDIIRWAEDTGRQITLR